jgi:hypothetical protein
LVTAAEIVAPTLLSGLFWLLPNQGEQLGNKLKAWSSASNFQAAWLRACAAMNIKPTPQDFPSFLQINIEGLCLLDAIMGRSGSENNFRIEFVSSTPVEFASAAHPSGPERNTVTVASSKATYVYRVNGRGVGEMEIRPRYRPWRRSGWRNINLTETMAGTAETACQP